MSIKEILTSAKTIAIVGCSSSPHRTSYRIAQYLLNKGFKIIPINPNEESTLGKNCYPSIKDIPDDIEIDIVNIFRNKRYTAEMVQEVVEWSKQTSQKPVIWTQIGVSSAEAKKLAEENGFTYIENKCIMVEHRNIS